MARAPRSIQPVVRTGLQPVYTAVDSANGEQIAHDGSPFFLHVKNTGGGVCNVTPRLNTAIATQLGATVTEPVIAVPATTGDRMIGPFPPALYQQADGNLYVDYSTPTGVTAAAIKSAL